MSLIKQLASQTAVYGLSNIVGRLLNYFLVPLYTRVFLPEEYGVVVELYAYVAFFIVLFTYGMETAFFKFSSQHAKPKKVLGTAFTSLLISSVVFMLLGGFVQQPLANLIGYEDHPEYIFWFVLILGFDAIAAIPFAYLRQQNKAGKFAWVKLLNIFTNIGLNLFFILLCPYLLEHSDNESIKSLVEAIYDPTIGVGYVFISNLVASFITLPLLLPEVLAFRYGFDKSLWKQMMPYALPLVIVGLAGMVNETLDRVLLKHLLPEDTNALAQLGIYGACYKIAVLMSLFIQSFRYAAEPFFFSNAKAQESGAIYARVMNYFVIVCLTIFLGVTLFIDVVKDFVGEEFHEGLGVVPILLVANMFLGIYYNLSIWYKLANKTKIGAYISLSGALVTIVLNLWLIPVYGYMGAAWATLASYTSMMLLCYWAGLKYYPIPYQLKNITILFLSAGFIYWLWWQIQPLINQYSTYWQYAVNVLLIGLFLLIAFISQRGKKVVFSRSK